MDLTDRPTGIIWDVTYACPLRCTHCYSESGRRSPKHVSHADMLRIADALTSLRPFMITLAGGEPLVLQRITEVGEHIAQAGIPVLIYTSGWSLRSSVVPELARVFLQTVVSVDGATADVHDRIRGRAGSFDRAMKALTMLENEAARRAVTGEAPLRYGIDYTVVRSNFRQVEEFCVGIAGRFPHLSSVSFGVAVPSGLANRTSYTEHELLTDAEVDQIDDPALVARLRSLAPNSIEIRTSTNRELQMHPDDIAATPDFRPLQVEPDGQVRAMPIYEGTVGSLLVEDPAVLWNRAQARWHDPFVVDTLRPARTMAEWAAAARRIDQHFGSAESRTRIAQRPAFLPLTPVPVSADSIAG